MTYLILNVVFFFFVGIGVFLVAQSVVIRLVLYRLRVNQRQEVVGLATLAFVDVIVLWLLIGFWAGILSMAILGWLVLIALAFCFFYFKKGTSWIYRSHFGDYIIEHVRTKTNWF